MQKAIFFLMMITMPLLSIAQGNSCLLKTYAYSRAVISGAAPTDIVEIGGTSSTQTSKVSKQYFVYLKTCAVNQVTVTAVWINGEAYTGKAQKTNTPVMLDDNTSSKKANETLVAKTSSNVWEVIISRDETMLKPTSTIQSLIKANTFVITGILNGKAFISSLKNIKELEPVAAQ